MNVMRCGRLWCELFGIDTAMIKHLSAVIDTYRHHRHISNEADDRRINAFIFDTAIGASQIAKTGAQRVISSYFYAEKRVVTYKERSNNSVNEALFFRC